MCGVWPVSISDYSAKGTLVLVWLERFSAGHSAQSFRQPTLQKVLYHTSYSIFRGACVIKNCTGTSSSISAPQAGQISFSCTPQRDRPTCLALAGDQADSGPVKAVCAHIKVISRSRLSSLISYLPKSLRNFRDSSISCAIPNPLENVFTCC